MVTVQPFHWREIVKFLLDAGGVVETVDEGENALRCFLPGAKATDGVHQFLLEDRVETLTPGVVTGLACSGKTLPEAKAPEAFTDRLAGVLAAAV